MGESDREDPPPPEPSLGDLIKSDEFQKKLEAAREKRAQIQAERAAAGRPGKLKPGRPAAPPTSEPSRRAPLEPADSPAPDAPGPRESGTQAPMVLDENRRVRNAAARIVPLTPGMRVPGRTGTDRRAAELPAKPARSPKGSRWRSLLTSLAGIVIGFAAGAIAMDLAGREVSLPLSGLLGREGGRQETGTIRPARNFELMAEAPAPPERVGPEPSGALPAPAAPLEAPPTPANGTGAAAPAFAAAAPEPPFARQAADSRVAIFGRESGRLDALAQRLDSLGVTEVETRPVDLALEGTVIRYYREEDAGLARNLAAALDATLQDLTSFRPRPAEPRIEIWAGRA